jgi:hypothetical protein
MTSSCHAADMQRTGEAIARPGMDTRIWASLATVTKLKVDPNGGVLADIVLMGAQSGTPETARVGASMASQGTGLYLPIEVDDEVLVVAPDGTPDAGLVIVAALWDRGTKPPATAAAHPADVLLQPPDGRTVRVVTTGGGEVLLGDPAAAHPTCRGDNLQATLNALISAFNRHVHVAAAPASPTSTPVEAFVLPDPPIPILATSSGPGDLSPNVKVS